MNKEMDEATFLNFYKNTALNYSVAMKKAISRRLIQEKLITFDPQTTLENQPDYSLFLSDKDNTEATIVKTTTDARFSQFYEKWELIKLYKYSVPFFFESDKPVEDLLKVAKVSKLGSQISRTLPAELKDAKPIYYKASDQVILVKFVFTLVSFLKAI